MKKIILTMLAAVSFGTPVFADPIDEEHFFSAHAQGCTENARLCSRT